MIGLMFVWYIIKKENEWMVKYIKGKNDLATLRPDLIEEWDFETNEIDPYKLIVGSGKKVWWKCKLGHTWQARVCDRKKGYGCPFCAGQKAISGVNDIATLNPYLADEWDYERNGDLLPTNTMGGSGKKVWWKCQFGHSWCVSPNSRLFQGTSCPICSNELKTSFPEQAIYYYFCKFGDVRNREVLSNKYEIDIYVPEIKMCIEYDGFYYHQSEKAKIREKEKNSFCDTMGLSMFRVKEVRYDEYEDEDNVLYRNPQKGLKELDQIIIKLLHKASELGMKVSDMDVCVDRDKVEIWSNYINLIKENSLKTMYPEIAIQWNEKRNGKLKPEHVSWGSKKKVWWICKEGHEWETTVVHRVGGTNCPYCSNKKVLPGFNDFASNYPELMKEWNYYKNTGINPNACIKTTSKKVWWKCKEGHEWEAAIVKRVAGTSCPYCMNRKVIKGYNDLGTLHKELLAEWDFSKNEISPYEITSNSNLLVWWKCKECGHEWKANPSHRMQGRGCPICAKTKRVITFHNNMLSNKKSLLEVAPELSCEWDYEKNGDLRPNMVTEYSNKIVWWVCSKQHEYQSAISMRRKGRGCPYCSNRKILKGYNDLATVNPRLVCEWNFERNGDITPDMVSSGSGKRVWWKCANGYEWTAIISERNKGKGNCPCEKCIQERKKNKKTL